MMQEQAAKNTLPTSRTNQNVYPHVIDTREPKLFSNITSKDLNNTFGPLRRN
jgi:hypothetical protein